MMELYLRTVMVVSLHHSRPQDGLLSSSLLREEMYLLQNLSSKQEPTLPSKIRYQLCVGCSLMASLDDSSVSLSSSSLPPSLPLPSISPSLLFISSSLHLSLSLQNDLTAIHVAAARRGSIVYRLLHRDRSRHYNEIIRLLQRYTQRSTPVQSHHVRTTPTLVISTLVYLPILVIQAGVTDQQSSQGRPVTKHHIPSADQHRPTTVTQTSSVIPQVLQVWHHCTHTHYNYSVFLYL